MQYSVKQRDVNVFVVVNEHDQVVHWTNSKRRANTVLAALRRSNKKKARSIRHMDAVKVPKFKL